MTPSQYREIAKRVGVAFVHLTRLDSASSDQSGQITPVAMMTRYSADSSLGWVNRIFTYQRAFQHPRRFITNEQIEVQDDSTATGYATWFVVQAREGQSYYGWGTYEWGFRREDGLWKICKMIITVECMTTLERGWGMLEERVAAFPARPTS